MSAAPVALTPPRPRRRWIWITVAVLTAAITVLPVLFRIWLKAAHQDQVMQTVVYRQPISKLRVVAPAGGVTLEPSSKPEVTVAGSRSWVFAKPYVTRILEARTLQITAGCPAPQPFEDCQVGLVIHVPVKLAVEVSTGSGTIIVTGLTGPLHLAVTSGSIAMTHVSGPVWASAGSGTVTGSALGSTTMEAVIGSGSLQLGLDAAPRDLNVAIGSGSANITVPAGTRVKVLADAGSGVLHLPRGLADAGAAGTMTATIGTGQLAVTYPRQPGGNSAG